MNEEIKEALEFEKLATDDALSLISVEANNEVSRLQEARKHRGEPPAKHETLRVRLEELENEIRMRYNVRVYGSNCGSIRSPLGARKMY